MFNFNQYHPALLGLAVTLATVAIQALIAAVVKARWPGAVPGMPPQQADHRHFVFRAQRTFLNSLENLPLMLGASVLCILSGAAPKITALLIWVYAAARILHMLLYYLIATDKNPSPRSYFFLIGFLSALGLLGLGTLVLI